MARAENAARRTASIASSIVLAVRPHNARHGRLACTVCCVHCARESPASVRRRGARMRHTRRRDRAEWGGHSWPASHWQCARDARPRLVAARPCDHGTARLSRAATEPNSSRTRQGGAHWSARSQQVDWRARRAQCNAGSRFGCARRAAAKQCQHSRKCRQSVSAILPARPTGGAVRGSPACQCQQQVARRSHSRPRASDARHLRSACCNLSVATPMASRAWLVGAT